MNVTRHVHLWLASVGILLLTPLIWLYARPSLRAGDLSLALAPIYESSLENLSNNPSATFTLSIPSDIRWKRVWSALGDPGYVVAAVTADRRTTYCFEKLGIEVQVIVGSVPAQTEPALEPLYGHSAQCLPIGIKFKANPGDQVTIRTITKSDARPPGYMLVMANWTLELKDRIVALDLNEELRGPIWVIGATGFFCLGLAYVWALKRRAPIVS